MAKIARFKDLGKCMPVYRRPGHFSLNKKYPTSFFNISTIELAYWIFKIFEAPGGDSCTNQYIFYVHN